MNRCVSLLLIPMFMLGHVLSHSHAGTGVGEPDGHSLRPHIHVSGHHHHHHHDDDGHDHHHAGDPSETDHSNDAGADTRLGSTDHDSDAVYLIDIDWTMSPAVAVPRVDLVTFAWSSPARSVNRVGCIGCPSGDPPDRFAGLPIYLLTASLRL